MQDNITFTLHNIYVLNHNSLNIQIMTCVKPWACANIQHTISITYDGRATYSICLGRSYYDPLMLVLLNAAL